MKLGPHSFTAYIDESGDDGLSKFRSPGASGGASNWLTISAIVLRTSNDLRLVKWRDEILAAFPMKRRRELHFANLSHGQRLASVKVIAGKQLRAISIISNKRTIPKETYTEKNQLYFYLTRYLIERISWLVRDARPKVPEGDGRVKITFSRRGGMSYLAFQEYLKKLKSSENLDSNIYWPVIDIEGIEARDHSTRAGLQLVDCVASAFAAAVEVDQYGNCEPRYSETLKPVVYHRNGNYLSYGAKLVPAVDGMELVSEQRRFLELYK